MHYGFLQKHSGMTQNFENFGSLFARYVEIMGKTQFSVIGLFIDAKVVSIVRLLQEVPAACSRNQSKESITPKFKIC